MNFDDSSMFFSYISFVSPEFRCVLLILMIFSMFQMIFYRFRTCIGLGTGRGASGVAFGNHPSASPRSPSFPDPVRPRPSTTGAPSHRAPTQKPCLNQANTIKTDENHANLHFLLKFLFSRGAGRCDLTTPKTPPPPKSHM